MVDSMMIIADVKLTFAYKRSVDHGNLHSTFDADITINRAGATLHVHARIHNVTCTSNFSRRVTLMKCFSPILTNKLDQLNEM